MSPHWKAMKNILPKENDICRLFLGARLKLWMIILIGELIIYVIKFYPGWSMQYYSPRSLPVALKSSISDIRGLQVPLVWQVSVGSQPTWRNPSLQTNSAFSPGRKTLWLLTLARHFSLESDTTGFGAVQLSFAINSTELVSKEALSEGRFSVPSADKHLKVITKETKRQMPAIFVLSTVSVPFRCCVTRIHEQWCCVSSWRTWKMCYKTTSW